MFLHLLRLFCSILHRALFKWFTVVLFYKVYLNWADNFFFVWFRRFLQFTWELALPINRNFILYKRSPVGHRSIKIFIRISHSHTVEKILPCLLRYFCFTNVFSQLEAILVQCAHLSLDVSIKKLVVKPIIGLQSFHSVCISVCCHEFRFIDSNPSWIKFVRDWELTCKWGIQKLKFALNYLNVVIFLKSSQTAVFYSSVYWYDFYRHWENFREVCPTILLSTKDSVCCHTFNLVHVSVVALLPTNHSSWAWQFLLPRKRIAHTLSMSAYTVTSLFKDTKDLHLIELEPSAYKKRWPAFAWPIA